MKQFDQAKPERQERYLVRKGKKWEFIWLSVSIMAVM